MRIGGNRQNPLRLQRLLLRMLLVRLPVVLRRFPGDIADEVLLRSLVDDELLGVRVPVVLRRCLGSSDFIADEVLPERAVGSCWWLRRCWCCCCCCWAACCRHCVRARCGRTASKWSYPARKRLDVLHAGRLDPLEHAEPERVLIVGDLHPPVLLDGANAAVLVPHATPMVPDPDAVITHVGGMGS